MPLEPTNAPGGDWYYWQTYADIIDYLSESYRHSPSMNDWNRAGGMYWSPTIKQWLFREAFIVYWGFYGNHVEFLCIPSHFKGSMLLNLEFRRVPPEMKRWVMEPLLQIYLNGGPKDTAGPDPEAPLRARVCGLP